jgi:hypothetical protein
MKLIAKLVGRKQRIQRKTLAQYQREVLIRQGREQFQKIVDRGLNIGAVSL